MSQWCSRYAVAAWLVCCWCVGRVQTIGHVKCLLIVGWVIVFLAFCGLRFLLVLFFFLLSVASLIIVGFILLTCYFRTSSVNMPICLHIYETWLCQGHARVLGATPLQSLIFSSSGAWLPILHFKPSLFKQRSQKTNCWTHPHPHILWIVAEYWCNILSPTGCSVFFS
jgi:hypothetical protein